MGKKNQEAVSPPEGAVMTRREKKAVWISAAVALAVLAALFFIGLFAGLRADNVFLPGFYWIANVIAAIASGALASTIAGFLTVKLDTPIRKGGRLMIQGAGGFAVFLMVMWANPQNQMFKLADTLFASLLSDCAQAARVGDRGLRANARESCIRLSSLYPLRPEPYAYLARWTHINKKGSFGEASDLYRTAIEKYGISSRPIRRSAASDLVLSSAQMIRLTEDISSYSFARGDYLITEFSQQKIGRKELLEGFDEIVEASYLLSDKLLNSDSDAEIWARAYDLRGRIYLYRYFLDDKQDIQNLKNAVAAYDSALVREKEYPLMLQYHRIVGLALLESRGIVGSVSTREAVGQMLTGWNSFFDAKWVLPERSFLKQVFSEVAENSRSEPWRITRPFGSKELGGAAIRAALSKDPELFARLEASLRKL